MNVNEVIFKNYLLKSEDWKADVVEGITTMVRQEWDNLDQVVSELEGNSHDYQDVFDALPQDGL